MTNTPEESKLSTNEEEIKKHFFQEDYYRIVNQNLDLLAYSIFYEKNILNYVHANIDYKLYYNNNIAYDLKMKLIFSKKEKENIPFNVLETLTKIFPKEMLLYLLQYMKGDKIKYRDLSLNLFQLKLIYTHFIKNRKKISKKNFLKNLTEEKLSKIEKSKQLHLLIESFYD